MNNQNHFSDSDVAAFDNALQPLDDLVRGVKVMLKELYKSKHYHESNIEAHAIALAAVDAAIDQIKFDVDDAPSISQPDGKRSKRNPYNPPGFNAATVIQILKSNGGIMPRRQLVKEAMTQGVKRPQTTISNLVKSKFLSAVTYGDEKNVVIPDRQ